MLQCGSEKKLFLKIKFTIFKKKSAIFCIYVAIAQFIELIILLFINKKKYLAYIFNKFKYLC